MAHVSHVSYTVEQYLTPPVNLKKGDRIRLELVVEWDHNGEQVTVDHDVRVQRA